MTDYLVHSPKARLSVYFAGLPWAMLCQKAHEAVVVITGELRLNEYSPERICARHLEMEEAKDKDNKLELVGDGFFEGSPFQEGLNMFTCTQVTVEEDDMLTDIGNIRFPHGGIVYLRIPNTTLLDELLNGLNVTGHLGLVIGNSRGRGKPPGLRVRVSQGKGGGH
jgi:hypothetical protein